MDKSASYLLFYDLFTELREKGFVLGINQYDWFWRIFLQTNIHNELQLLNLCQTVWLTRPTPAYQQEFEQLFYAHLKRIPTQFWLTQALNAPVAAPIDRKEPDLPTPKEVIPGDVKNISDGETIPPKIPSPTSSILSPNVEIWFSITPGQETAASQTSISPSGSVKDISYIFHDPKHYPFATRKTGQTFRKMQTRTVSELTDDLDLPAIIQERVRDGYVRQLRYKTRRKGIQDVIWLSDHSNTMIPYEPWENALHRIVADCPLVSQIQQYFFHIYPSPTPDNDFMFFSNRAHARAVMLSTILKKCKKDTLVLIFSDAGAAKKQFDTEHLQIFYNLVSAIRAKTKRMVWVNPVRHLSGTTAGYLSFTTPMHYPDNDELKRLVAGL